MYESLTALPSSSVGGTRFPAAVFLAIFLFLMVFGRDRMFRDPGTFWHTVVGRQIIATHQIVRTDPFGFRRPGQRWIDQQWLGEVIMAMIDRVAGLDGLLLASAALLAFVFAWLARRLIAAGITTSIAVTLTSLGVAACSFHFMPRPHLISMALMAWTMAQLCDFGAGRIGVMRFARLVPAICLWANIHGAALGGLATVWMVALGWAFERCLLRGRSRGPTNIAAPIWIAAACTGAIFVNPFGVELPQAWIQLMRMSSLPTVIVEHAPLSLRSIDGWMLAFLFLAYLVVLLGFSRHSFHVTEIVPLIWFALTCQRIRHGPLFAMTALVVMADLFARRPSQAPDTKQTPVVPVAFGNRRFAGLGCVGLVLVLFAAQAAGIRIPAVGAGCVRLDPTYWPVDAAPTLRERVRSGPRAARTVNEVLFGGFLTYFVPGASTWIDDRCELYGPDLDEYMTAYRHHPDRIREWADRYDADTLLVAAGSPFERALQNAPPWRCIHRDHACAVFAR